MIEGRGGFFYFQDNLPRKIYGQGCLDLEAEGSIFFKKNLGAWLNFNYNFASGNSIELQNKTSLTMLSLSLGPKAYLFAQEKHLFNPYLGIGVLGLLVKTSDHSPYLPQLTTRYKIGGVAKSGIFMIKGSICLDLFFDYYISNIRSIASAEKNPINMGGFKTGLGMGYVF